MGVHVFSVLTELDQRKRCESRWSGSHESPVCLMAVHKARLHLHQIMGASRVLNFTNRHYSVGSRQRTFKNPMREKSSPNNIDGQVK